MHKEKAGDFHHPAFFNAGDRNRTGTVLPQQDFKSCASASSATPAYLSGQRRIRTFEGGANRFTVCHLWPLGNLPIITKKAIAVLNIIESGLLE